MRSLDDSSSAGADVERVDAEPQVRVEDSSEQWRHVTEDSENEDDDKDSVDDEVTEHLAWVVLKVIKFG